MNAVMLRMVGTSSADASGVILRRTRLLDEHHHAAPLSIHSVQGGTVEVLHDGRRVLIDDDTYIVVESGEPFTLRANSTSCVEVLSIFIDDRLVQAALEEREPESDPVPLPEQRTFHFSEHVQPHDSLVSPVLRFLRHHAVTARENLHWRDEQLRFLVQRLAARQQRNQERIEAIDASRASTRQEIFHRVGLATDFIYANYTRPVTLAAIARAVSSSPHHIMRMFRQVHGLTPREFLQRKRVAAAVRLLSSGTLSLDEIAGRVGFEDRSTLARRMRRHCGMTPSRLRDSRERTLPDLTY
jgi:AraC family transcriptional regulator